MENKTEPCNYQTITEIQDWGPAITRVIINLGMSIPPGSITIDTFEVYVKISDNRLDEPVIAEGTRTITRAFISDINGNPSTKAENYVVLEMEIGPEVRLSSPMNFNVKTNLNDWTQNEYKITQIKDIKTEAGIVSGVVVDNFLGGVVHLVDEFTRGEVTYNDVKLTFAEFAPKNVTEKKPLIIWLHGLGEGGTDVTIPLSGNKAVNFASDKIQAYFGGAYVLMPQTPTYWMDGITGFCDGTSKYEGALIALIKDYVSKNKEIDLNRVYVGGCSNGGYMTMLLIRDYPDYFAAAFPICEALPDKLITDENIQKMKDVPTWFVTAANDPVLPVEDYTVPTYERLVAAGAKNVQMTLFDNVIDTSGLYKNEGKPHEYNGHWSWIYVYNNEVSKTIDGKEVTIMEWLANQSK